MRTHDLDRYRVELADLIEKWFQEHSDRESMPLLGNGTSLYMASAALAVLEAMDESQDYLRGAGLLKDEEE